MWQAPHDAAINPVGLGGDRSLPPLRRRCGSTKTCPQEVHPRNVHVLSVRTTSKDPVRLHLQICVSTGLRGSIVIQYGSDGSPIHSLTDAPCTCALADGTGVGAAITAASSSMPIADAQSSCQNCCPQGTAKHHTSHIFCTQDSD